MAPSNHSSPQVAITLLLWPQSTTFSLKTQVFLQALLTGFGVPGEPSFICCVFCTACTRVIPQGTQQLPNISGLVLCSLTVALQRPAESGRVRSIPLRERFPGSGLPSISSAELSRVCIANWSRFFEQLVVIEHFREQWIADWGRFARLAFRKARGHFWIQRRWRKLFLYLVARSELTLFRSSVHLERACWELPAHLW